MSLLKKKDADLKKELAEQRKALREFRFGVAGSKVKDMKAARNIRRNIARILTEMRRRTRAEQEVAAKSGEK